MAVAQGHDMSKANDSTPSVFS